MSHHLPWVIPNDPPQITPTDVRDSLSPYQRKMLRRITSARSVEQVRVLMDEISMNRAHEPLSVLQYGSALTAVAEQGKWKYAVAILDAMSEVGVAPTAVAYAIAMHACSKAGQWGEIVKLYKRMDAEGIQGCNYSATEAIHAYGKLEDWEGVKEFILEIQAKGHTLSMVDYQCLVTLTGSSKRWDAFDMIIEELEEMPNVDPRVYAAAINAYSSGNETARSEDFVGRLLGSSDVKLDTDACVEAMYAFLMSRNWDRLREVWTHMRGSGIPINNRACLAFAVSCEHTGDVAGAVSLFDVTKDEDISMGFNTFGAIARTCAAHGEEDMAVEFIRELMHNESNTSEKYNTIQSVLSVRFPTTSL